MFPVLIELVRLEFRIVHLSSDIDQFLEKIGHLVEVVELEIGTTNIGHQIQDIFLALDGCHRIDIVEGILLQYDKVDQLRFPEGGVILRRYAVVSQNIDLFGDLLTTQQAGLGFVHLLRPVGRDMFRDIFLKFGIFDIFGIGVDGVDGRIAFLVRTVLLQRVETAGHFLGVFGHGLLEVTTGR